MKCSKTFVKMYNWNLQISFQIALVEKFEFEGPVNLIKNTYLSKINQTFKLNFKPNLSIPNHNAIKMTSYVEHNI
jgi:hypothetical protein